jgi:transposase InsO family protein
MPSTLAQSLPYAALQMALLHRQPAPGLLHHSDRGGQYAAGDYQALLTTHNMLPSMSRKGDCYCYDNAVVESFFATLEWELIERHDGRTRQEARAAIFEYIEVWSQSPAASRNVGLLQPSCV